MKNETTACEQPPLTCFSPTKVVRQYTFSTPELFCWLRERRALGNPETKCLSIGFRGEQWTMSLIGAFVLARWVSRCRKIQIGNFLLWEPYGACSPTQSFPRALGRSEALVTRMDKIKEQEKSLRVVCNKASSFPSPQIDLFSLYILFSNFRPRDVTLGKSFFQMSSYTRVYVRIT